MATGVKSWSTTAANNDSADSGINWLEGQAPSTVNDSARAMMAAIKSWYNQIAAGMIVSGTVGGTADAITLTNSPTVDSLATGQQFLFKYTSTGNTGAVTLNVDGLGATALRYKDVALVANDIATNDWVACYYDGTRFQLLTKPRLSWAATDVTTDTTGGDVADLMVFADASESNALNKVTVQKFYDNSITSLTADTAPDAADNLVTYDASATAAKKITVTNLYKAINTLTADTAPDFAADYVATYDASATTSKKVLIGRLSGGVLTKSAGYTVAAADAGALIKFSGLSASVTAALPAAATAGAGFTVTISNEDTTTATPFAVTIDPSGTETIDGFTTRKMWRGSRVTIRSDGSNWFTVSGKYIFISDNQTISASTTINPSHNLRVKPDRVWCYLVCLTTELGYAVGDYAFIANGDAATGAANGITFYPDTSAINGVFGSGASMFFIINRTTNATSAITPARWALVVCAEA